MVNDLTAKLKDAQLYARFSFAFNKISPPEITRPKSVSEATLHY
jgi:hypothetical protein